MEKLSRLHAKVSCLRPLEQKYSDVDWETSGIDSIPSIVIRVLCDKHGMSLTVKN